MVRAVHRRREERAAGQTVALVLAALLVAGCLDTSMPKAPGKDVPAVADVDSMGNDDGAVEIGGGCDGACGIPGCDVPGCPSEDVCAGEGPCCTPEAGKQCFGDAVHWVDSCGGKGEEIVVCKNGCDGGQCKDCTPDCAGKECGPDNCGGECGQCDDGHACTADSCNSGQCKALLTAGCLIGSACVDEDALDSGNPCRACKPAVGKEEWTTLEDGTPCGDFSVCQGGKCGCSFDACGAGCCDDGQVCHGGECCTPDCIGKDCGDDGCGGSCGECQGLQVCQEGKCACEFAACGQACCPKGEVCAGAKCCLPKCEGKQCGSDGCGGECGSCAPGQVCIQGVCPEEGKECFDGNEVPWDGCTDGMLSEFVVPEEDDGDQDAASAVFLPDGAFVVAWRDAGKEPGLGDVVLRRFSSDGTSGGTAAGNAALTSGTQTDPRLATLVDGNLVLVWESCPPAGQPAIAEDGSGCGVFARRFGAGLTPLQKETKVNTTTTDQQRNPAVAPLPGGKFIVVWESCPPPAQPDAGQDGSGCGIFGQLFTVDGQPSLGEFVVPVYTTSEQFAPSVASLADGGFVVVWQGAGEGDSAGVFGRVYTSEGVAGAKQFTLSDKVSNTQEGPVVTRTAGGFVAAWESWGQDGDGYGVFGQLFAANGAKLGAEMIWSQTTSGNQRFPRLTGIPDGICAGWSDWGLDGDGGCVVIRSFDAAAKPTGKEIVANEFSPGDQMLSCLAAGPDGTVLVVWSGQGQASSGSGVFARRFSPDGKGLYH